jgi:hypothetical protein
MSGYITGRKFVVRTLVLFPDQARTEVLTTNKFYNGQVSEHDITESHQIYSWL